MFSVKAQKRQKKKKEKGKRKKFIPNRLFNPLGISLLKHIKCHKAGLKINVNLRTGKSLAPSCVFILYNRKEAGVNC